MKRIERLFDAFILIGLMLIIGIAGSVEHGILSSSAAFAAGSAAIGLVAFGTWGIGEAERIKAVRRNRK